MSGEFKSRTSSGGKSLFSRSRQKDKKNTSDESLGVDQEKTKRNASKSPRSSRHLRNSSSSMSVEENTYSPGADRSGSGAVTSVPYDKLVADNRSPIPVEYLPRVDQMPIRRDKQPHQPNKASPDFHQHSSLESQPSGKLNSHIAGARSHTSNANLTMASTGGKPQLQQWGPNRGSGSSAINGYYSRTESNYTNSTVSSTYGRSSFDQEPGATRSSTASGNSTRTTIPATLPNSPNSNLPSSNTLHRDLNRQNKLPPTPPPPQQPFSANRPTSERFLEEEFLALMQKRGWHNLPEQARRQMLAYPPEKKWTLVYQDRLTEYQGDQKRRTALRNTGQYGQYGREIETLNNADEEGTPEWFVKRVMDNTITAKQLQSLNVSLRTQPIGWVKTFIECQGQVALTNVLGKLNRRQAQGPAPPTGSTSEKDLEREYDILKCLKALMNNKYGADDALAHQQIIVALATSLISPRLTSRKLVSEILTFLCHWADGQGHMKVI